MCEKNFGSVRAFVGACDEVMSDGVTMLMLGLIDGGATTVGCVTTGNIGVGEGGDTAIGIVVRPTLCTWSAQPPASRQCALHIRRPQSLRTLVELQPIVRQVGLCGATGTSLPTAGMATDPG